MLKIVSGLFLTSLLIVPRAFAAEHEEGMPSPPQELAQVIQCEAIDLTLARLHNQIAASITALSGPVGLDKLTPMIKSQLALAADSMGRAKSLSEIAKQTVIPEMLKHGMSQEDINSGGSELLSKSLGDITDSLDDPEHSVVEQVAMQKLLQQQADKCESFGVGLLKAHTF